MDFDWSLTLTSLEPSCMSNTDLIVNVWRNSQDMERGVLTIKADVVSITLESGKILSSQNSSNVLFSLVGDIDSSQFKCYLNPILIVNRPYATDLEQYTEDIFPLSTGGFYGRLRAGKDDAVYIIQRIENDAKFLLIIGNPKSGLIYETQIIQPYEAEALGLDDDQELQNSWDAYFWSDKEMVL